MRSIFGDRPKSLFAQSPLGEPFFFKLKAPHNAIGGFGYFARYTRAPISLVWEAFRTKNGARTLAELRQQTSALRRQSPHLRDDYEIGCIMISLPTFFPREMWIPQPADFRGPAVSGKGYDLARGEAAQIFERCKEVERLFHGGFVSEPDEDAATKYGEPYLIKPRLGQGTFRLGLLDAYGRACAVSGEHSLPVLEAAHIRPFAGAGTHRLENGILLRLDIHRLFDKGYVTIDEDRRFIVSRRLKEEFDNGRTYYAFHGKSILLPPRADEQPSLDSIRWHNETVFRD